MTEKFRKLPIFKIVPLECEFTEIAITEDPAIEEYFLKFNSEEIKLEFNTDKQVITGAVMLPNKLIYRNDALGERFVTYDEDGIRTAASLFMKNGLRFNSEHTENILPIEILESYFAKEDNEFNVPKGSWIVSAKVNDKTLWSKLKESNLGFSFQSIFSNELIGMEQINFNKNEMDLKEKLSTAINVVLFAVEAPAEITAPVEAPVEAPTKTEVTPEMVNEAITKAIEVVMQEVDAKFLAFEEKINGTQAEFKSQLEKFSNEPLSVPVTETVEKQVAKGDSNPALRFFNEK